MNIPKQIKVGNREIKVEIKPLVDLHGQYDPMTYILSIHSGDNRMAQIETFWHELIHIINDYNEFTTMLVNEMVATQADGGDPEIRAYNLEEQMTQGFSQVLLQVIKDNNLLNLT